LIYNVTQAPEHSQWLSQEGSKSKTLRCSSNAIFGLHRRTISRIRRVEGNPGRELQDQRIRNNFSQDKATKLLKTKGIAPKSDKTIPISDTRRVGRFEAKGSLLAGPLPQEVRLYHQAKRRWGALLNHLETVTYT
jgi:hypothetical protein